MGLRVWDRGGSEGWPVMGRIEIESSGNIIPREGGQTSARFLITRESGQATKEARQMAGERARSGRRSVCAILSPGAASHREDGWDQIDWRHVNDNARRLQMRIVKATKEAGGAGCKLCNAC